MIRVQKGKFSGREIYDIVVAVVVVVIVTHAALVTTRILFRIFFYSLSPLPLRYQNSTLEAVTDTQKNGKMKNAFRESLLPYNSCYS